jgi:nucleoid-associated protein YgaU
MSLHEAHRSPARRIDDLQLLQGLLTQRLYVPEYDRRLLRALLAETPRELRPNPRATRRAARRLRATGAVLALSGALALTLGSPLLTAVAASPQPASWVAVADSAADNLAPQTSDVLLRALLDRDATSSQVVATADQTAQTASPASDVLLRALLNSESTPIQAVAAVGQALPQADAALAQAQLTVGKTLVIPAAQVATDAIAAPSGSVEQQATRYYVVRPGDTLSGIAQVYYGNGDLWPTIFNANTDKIANPHWIYPDQQLVIPAVAGTTGVASANTSGASTTSVTPHPQAAQAPISQYTVQSGDTLSGIAYYAYGHANWQGIYQANSGQISNPDLIYPGQVLTIP